MLFEPSDQRIDGFKILVPITDPFRGNCDILVSGNITWHVREKEFPWILTRGTHKIGDSENKWNILLILGTLILIVMCPT